MSAQIKLIDENTDISALDMRRVDWDVVLNGIPYQVVRIDGYVHSIGGMWGDNNLWAHPYAEDPTCDNLIQFNGLPCNWGISAISRHYARDKYGDRSMECTSMVQITRNGKPFYSIPCADMACGISKALYLLQSSISEHPLCLNERGWEESAVGQKVWYCNQPAVIRRFSDTPGEMFIVPDGKELFDAPAWAIDDGSADMWVEDYGDGLYVDIFSELITWYRGDGSED